MPPRADECCVALTSEKSPMRKEIALEISSLMLEYGAKLDSSVALVMANGSAEEAQRYRRAVGKIMGEMLIEIMNPIYAEHPDLKPPQLR
jgi:hypothetical protein